jgi:hypothetical protein
VKRDERERRVHTPCSWDLRQGSGGKDSKEAGEKISIHPCALAPLPLLPASPLLLRSRFTQVVSVMGLNL